MVWVDRFAQLFWVLGLVGVGIGVYVIANAKSRNVWAYVATALCLLGVVLPVFGVYLVPDRLESWLLPVTVQGAVVSFFLNVGPWFYLVPQALPEPKRGRRKRA